MKAICCTVAALAFALTVMAGGGGGGTGTAHDEYCAEMKDGKLTVMYMNKPITADATLSNGTVVKIDGTIIHKDGVRENLKSGQCITMDGKIMSKEENKKREKEMKKKDDM